MKKKILSVLLIFVLAFGFVSPALAEDVSTPATAVRFFSVVGQGGNLDIETAIVVKDYYNDHITEYPSLYTMKDGVLTLLRTFKIGECNCGERRYKDSDGNYLPCQAYIQLLYTDVEFLTFDFTADYVLKIPAGIYKDVSDNPVGQQLVSVKGADIVNDRNEFTRFGRIYEQFRDFLLTFHKMPFFGYFISAFDNVNNYVFGILNIKIIQPVTMG